MDFGNLLKEVTDSALVGKVNDLPGHARGILQLRRIEDMDLHGSPGGISRVVFEGYCGGK